MTTETNSSCRINFIVGSNFLIEWYSSENMTYYLEPSIFVGCDMRSILNLDEPYNSRVRNAFDTANETNVTVSCQYMLADSWYTAFITPLSNLESGRTYFIEVSPGEVSIKTNSSSRLNFIVGCSFLIEQYSAENMQYYIEPSKFVGQDMRSVLNLDEPYNSRVRNAFDTANESNVTVSVQYMLVDSWYTAFITPLGNLEDGRSYFIKVSPD